MEAKARCKGCGRPVFWRYTPADKMIPLDPEASRIGLPGSFVMVDEANCRPSNPLFDEPGTQHHMNHVATCPKAQEFRTK